MSVEYLSALEFHHQIIYTFKENIVPFSFFFFKKMTVRIIPLIKDFYFVNCEMWRL